MDEQTKAALIEYAQTVGMAAAKLKQTIANVSLHDNTETEVNEAAFSVLNFEKRTSTRLGDYEIAAKTTNKEPAWTQALNILARNNAAINSRYHAENYVYSYWLYSEDQDRIYRQKLKAKPKNSNGGCILTNYRTWARLNLEGKREWGDIFPDGKVPVQSIATQHAKLEGVKDVESVFTINWKELSTELQQVILEKLSRQTGATKDAILKDILKVGLPLRRRYTASCGTKRMELFI